MLMQTVQMSQLIRGGRTVDCSSGQAIVEFVGAIWLKRFYDKNRFVLVYVRLFVHVCARSFEWRLLFLSGVMALSRFVPWDK